MYAGLYLKSGLWGNKWRGNWEREGYGGRVRLGLDCFERLPRQDKEKATLLTTTFSRPREQVPAMV